MTTKSFINHRVLWLLIPLLTLFNLSAWGANQTYTLVSNLSTLSSTDKVLIVSSNGSSSYYALKNGQKTTASNLPETSVTITSNTITADLDADYTWYLEYKDNETISGNSYRRYYIKSTAGTYYLQNAGATGSLITTKSGTDLQNVWVIGYQGSASIKVSGKTSTYYCTGLYNRSNSRMLAHQSSDWRCQASGNWNNLSNRVVQIYKQESSCSNAVTLSKGSESHGTVTTIGSTSVETCSSTASDRRVTITITPAECYDAPSTLTWTKSSGTVSASKQSGPTDNGNGTYSYVYQFAQNDNGAGTFGVTCTAKAAGKTVNFDAGPGVSASSSLTETCDGSGVTLPTVTASGVCKGWTTFAGWATAAVNDSSTTSVTVYAADSKFVPASNGQTLYAVYSKNKSGGSSSVTIAPEDLDVTSGNAINGATVGTITFGGAKGGNGTASNVPKYYSGTPNTIRCYASNDFTISSSNTISQIDFTYDGSYSGGTITPNTGSWAATPTTNWNQTWTGSATSITFRIGSSAWRITSIKITTGGGPTTYYCSDPNCCTPLGTINGSNNLTITPAANSITVAVKTDGVGAYGDASNVSGYEFKLYTSAEGGSAAASYSSASSAGTSHEFTGLTPLTQYWVTVRPIGSGSYCNTTAESDRVAIYTYPGSPNHVDVSGRWDRFGGETISLTAAAYATAGTGTAIPAAKITGYQWQKWYNSQWNNISNAGTTSGATTNNLQITSCSNENSGSYRCVVSTVAGCDIASDGFQVKVYVLECYTGGTTVYNFTRVGDTQAGTAQITLTAGNKEFKVHADNDYYGKNETINEDVTNVVLCNSGDAVCSSNLTIAAGLGGTFTINMEYSTSGSSSVEGEPEISVTYPRKTIFLTPGVWNADGAKFAFYYFRGGGSSGWTDFITPNDCGSSADIPQWNGVKIDAVRLKNTCSTPNWGDQWDGKQTNDITVTSDNCITITGWNRSDFTYGTYSVPTYTISYAKGTVPTGGGSISGSKANETKTCGVDFTLPAAQFTTTGYVQTGWSKSDGGAQYAAVSGTYTDNAAQTFYPVWTANTHTLTWDANGGDALTGDYTSGTVAYATAITAPNTPTWTGHTFTGWHNGSSVVTPATSMPDNDLTYTAQWSLATYTVTLNTNGGTINAGNVTSYTYGTGATLPTNVTKDGNRFDGWFDNSSCTGVAVASISSSATGNKEYWAKWTPVRTVTWSVNGSTWSSGVVEGNTHVISGEKVSALPTAPTKSDCDDAKVFVGWRATAIDGTSTSDPGDIFTTQAGSPTIDADKTFYAVFADRSGGDNTLVTNVSELTNGTQVYFYAETSDDPAFTAVMKAYESGNNVRAVSGSVSNNKLTPSDGACLYTIGTAVYSETTGYTFNDGTNYLYAASTSSNHLKSRAAIEADGWAIFSISITDGVASISSIGNTSRGVLQFNKNNDTGDYTAALFACYASEANTRQNVQIFKKTPFVYSNYVTTCASCDADATYTNTTPTVSEIECTDATLTMPGGLATLGGDGCNISDYGFVIGTSDNPAVGGDGVTKFQVGTSNPTLSNDFSYNATGLTKGTHYYVRAYATNLHGTAYSSTSTNFWTKNVSSISITTAPTKTNYIVGETFDATGMVVTATMASGSTENVTSAVTYSTDPLTAGANKDFAINYTLCETDKSVNQKINVYTLSVSEGDNPTYGDYSVSGAVITVTPGAQKTFSFATTNCSTRDNGNGTYTVINVTGNATVVINYRNAVQVKVYYKVDGTTITSLTQDVYESSQTTLPTASALSSAMSAQGMALPDELYPNFIGWSETEFGAQTTDPTIVEGTPIINAEKNYYAVYSNVNKIRIDESDITSTSYPGSEQTLTKSSKDFKYHYVCKNSTYYLQFKKNSTQFGYIYNNTAIGNITKIEVGASGDNDFVPVYAGSAANTISGSKLTDEDISEYKYVYLFPSNTQYFIIKGDNSYTYKVNYIDIFYASSTVYYMTQFCTRYAVTGASTSGTAVIVNGNTGGTLTSSHNELCEGKSLTLSATVNTQYSFGEWKIVKTGAEPEVDLTADLLGANKTSLTPPAFSMPGYGITVSATISEKTATAWSWTYNSAAIPDPMILYVGEVKQLDVTYTPDASQLVSTQKNYSVTKESSPVAEHAKAMNYYKMRGAAGVTEETNATVTFSLNSLTQVVNVTVRPLPSATFEDNVHNAISTTVTATVTDGVVSLTKKTPTHADISPVPASGNSCEKTHLHLVGWIDGDWEPYINYINGGSRPSDSDITSATGYFYLPNADIDLSQKGGKTYYAVWGKADE